MEENMEKTQNVDTVESTQEEIKEESTEVKTFTQEQLESIVKERLERQKKKYEEKYSDYESIKQQLESKSEDESKLGEFQKKIDEMQETISKYEMDSVKTIKEIVCLEMGIPKEFASRLNGTDEKSIREDASAFAQFVNPNKVPPKRNPESSYEDDGVLAAFKKLNPNIEI